MRRSIVEHMGQGYAKGIADGLNMILMILALPVIALVLMGLGQGINMYVKQAAALKNNKNLMVLWLVFWPLLILGFFAYTYIQERKNIQRYARKL